MTKRKIITIILNREKLKKIKKEGEKMENNNFWEENNEEKSLTTPDNLYNEIEAPDEEKKEDRYYEVFNKDKPKSILLSLLSVISGVLSVGLSFFGIVGIIFGIGAVVLSAISRINLKYFDKLSVVGMILGIFGAVFGISTVIFNIIALSVEI